MSPIELEKLLNKIAWGARYIKVKDSSGTEIILKIKDLDLNDRVWIDFVYEQAITDAKESKLLSESELAVFLDKHGVWTPADEKDIQNHVASVMKLTSQLESSDITKREKKRLKRVISSVQQSLDKKKAQRAQHFSSSLEGYADDERIRAILFCVSCDINGNRFWETWEDFCNESDRSLLSKITSELSKNKPLTVAEIRAVARSPIWRSKWLASKNCGGLFEKSLIQLTRNQEMLVYWSQVYDSVYESLDRPSQEIIEDDEALDKWFEEQRNKKSVEQISSGSKNKYGISRGVGRHGEVGVVTNEALLRTEQQKGWGGGKAVVPPSTEEVNDLNDPLSKKFLQVQRRRLKDAGVIREQDLRLDSDSRRVIGASDVVFEKRKMSNGYTGKAITQRHQGGTLKGRRLEG